MRDLIRNYKKIISGCESQETSMESLPLLSSHSSGSSHGSIQTTGIPHDLETTDSEEDGVKTIQVCCLSGGSGVPAIDIFTEDENILDRHSKCSKAKGILFVPPLISEKRFESLETLELQPTQSSLVTIFTIWNTIVGTSLLAMPWGIAQAGLFPGMFLNIAIAGICLYTCYILLKINDEHGFIGQDNEIGLLCRVLLGRWAEVVARAFSVIVLIGSNIVYWVLMSNFLYNSVYFIHGYFTFANQTETSSTGVLCPKEADLNLTTIDLSTPAILEMKRSSFDQYWDLYRTVPLFLALIIFPLLNFKSPTFFTKFTSIGTVSVMYLLIFVATKSSMWGINMANWKIELEIKPTFCALSGMLSLSYFIHNIIISVMRNNRYPRNNGRDLSIAFCLVAFTYLFIGGIFYICFPLAKSCIEDNIFNNFAKSDIMTIIARLLLLFQLFTVFPLMTYMLRLEVFTNMALLMRECINTYSYWRVVIVNISVVSICIMFACFLPKIGTLIRYTGALSGMIYIFLLPSLLKIALLNRKQMLTFGKLLFYCLVILFGILNLISQFFIVDK